MQNLNVVPTSTSRETNNTSGPISLSEDQGRRKKIVLIDDDKDCQAIFQAMGNSIGVDVQVYGSLAEMPSFAQLQQYDVAIFDYFLETFIGTEIAQYVDAFFPSLPVVIISSKELNSEEQNWPSCVKGFFNKNLGPIEIIKQSLKEVEKVNFYEQFKTPNLSYS